MRDRDSGRRARALILAGRFDRLILVHGRCLPIGARPFVERAFAWLG